MKIENQKLLIQSLNVSPNILNSRVNAKITSVVYNHCMKIENQKLLIKSLNVAPDNSVLGVNEIRKISCYNLSIN
jgi:hypothetical protein